MLILRRLAEPGALPVHLHSARDRLLHTPAAEAHFTERPPCISARHRALNVLLLLWQVSTLSLDVGVVVCFQCHKTCPRECGRVLRADDVLADAIRPQVRLERSVTLWHLAFCEVQPKRPTSVRPSGAGRRIFLRSPPWTGRRSGSCRSEVVMNCPGNIPQSPGMVPYRTLKWLKMSRGRTSRHPESVPVNATRSYLMAARSRALRRPEVGPQHHRRSNSLVSSSFRSQRSD